MTTGVPRRAPERREAAPISVTVSDRLADVDLALEVVHRGFVQAGYTRPRPSGRRMHASYLNPGTRFAIARIAGEPVGTVAMVNDGPFGLPSDRAFVEEIDALREGGPVREVGSLVVDARFRRHTRHIYMHMLATMVRLVFDMEPRTNVVLSVTPENARFTSGMFGCDEVGDARLLYGAPAVLLRTTAAQLHECYAEPRTSSRRLMRRLVFEPDPDWLNVHVCDDSWPPEWRDPLLEEEGTLARLRSQAELLGWRCERTAP